MSVASVELSTSTTAPRYMALSFVLVLRCEGPVISMPTPIEAPLCTLKILQRSRGGKVLKWLLRHLLRTPQDERKTAAIKTECGLVVPAGTGPLACIAPDCKLT